MYGLKILLQHGKRGKTKIQKMFDTNCYVCRSCNGKTGMGVLFALNLALLIDQLRLA